MSYPSFIALPLSQRAICITVQPTACKRRLKMSLLTVVVLDYDIYGTNSLVVKSMQRSAIRTQIQPSIPKREITKITNISKNTKRTYGQPSEQLFNKRWPLSNPNRTKHNMNTRKVKRQRNSGTKNRQLRTTTKLPPWNGQ